MFEEIGGLPLHPLVLHAAVVFVPLQVLLALGYALLPALRRATLWAVVAVSVLAHSKWTISWRMSQSRLA